MAMGNLDGVRSDFVQLEGVRRIKLHVLTAGERTGNLYCSYTAMPHRQRSGRRLWSAWRRGSNP